MTSTAALSGQARFSIMCHPARRHMAENLAAALGHDANVRLVEANPEIRSTLDTAGRALAPDGENCRYEVVLQDDVTLADDFLDSLRTLLPSVMPDSIVALFAAAHSETAALGRVLWVSNGPGQYPVIDAYAPCTGMVMCRDTASEASGYLRARFSLGSWRADDRILHEYARKAGLRKLVALPNLVDHDRYRSSSLQGHDLPGLRRSMLFADDADLAAPARWQPASVRDGHEVAAPYLHWDGLTEQYVRWTAKDGGRLCGPFDLIHDRPDRGIQPTGLAGSDDAVALDGLACGPCAAMLGRHAYQLGLAQRWLDERSDAALDVPPALLASAVFGASRKYHTREQSESAVAEFIGKVAESRRGSPGQVRASGDVR